MNTTDKITIGRCKATPKNPHGPKIEMEGQQPKVTRDYVIIRRLK